MKIYEKINFGLILSFVLLYPILPSYGLLSGTTLLYLLAFVELLGLLFISNIRKKFINTLKNLHKDKILSILLILNLLMYFSVFISYDKRLCITNSIRFTLYIFIFYSISYKIKDKNKIKILIYSFLAVSTLSGFVSLIQTIWLKINGGSVNSDHRLSSFLENPNNLGAYTMLSIFIVILLALKVKKRSYKLFFSISAALLFCNVVLSQSRNALIGLVIGVLLISVLYDKRFIIISFLIPIVLLILPQSRLRILEIFDFTQNSSRIKIWKTAKLMIKDNPIWGVGYENFSANYPNYIYHNPDLMIHGSYKALHPHNVFLKFQVELGILGTIIFLAFIIITICQLFKLSRNKNLDSFTNIFITGSLISFITFISMNLLDCYFGSLKVITTLFVLLAFSNHYILKFKSK